MRRRLLGIFALLVATPPLALAGAFLAMYLPARARISAALAEVPLELRPPPHAFFEAALCVHHHGVGHVAARRLLEANGLAHARASVWAARYFVWTQAVKQRSAEEQMALFAHTLPHEAGVGLVSGARTRFSRSPDELTRLEALELIVDDYVHEPSGRERLRRTCS